VDGSGIEEETSRRDRVILKRGLEMEELRTNARYPTTAPATHSYSWVLRLYPSEGSTSVATLA
jgi:hypothetical protein